MLGTINTDKIPLSQLGTSFASHSPLEFLSILFSAILVAAYSALKHHARTAYPPPQSHPLATLFFLDLPLFNTLASVVFHGFPPSYSGGGQERKMACAHSNLDIIFLKSGLCCVALFPALDNRCNWQFLRDKRDGCVPSMLRSILPFKMKHLCLICHHYFEFLLCLRFCAEDWLKIIERHTVFAQLRAV